MVGCVFIPPVCGAQVVLTYAIGNQFSAFGLQLVHIGCCCALQVFDNGVHAIVLANVLEGTPCLVAGQPPQVKAVSEVLQSMMKANAPSEYQMDMLCPVGSSQPGQYMHLQLLLITKAPKNFQV